MNKEFEAIVMTTYAELCIMWRVAHVTNQDQAEDFDAKLKSLEAVVDGVATFLAGDFHEAHQLFDLTIAKTGSNPRGHPKCFGSEDAAFNI